MNGQKISLFLPFLLEKARELSPPLLFSPRGPRGLTPIVLIRPFILVNFFCHFRPILAILAWFSPIQNCSLVFGKFQPFLTIFDCFWPISPIPHNSNFRGLGFITSKLMAQFGSPKPQKVHSSQNKLYCKFQSRPVSKQKIATPCTLPTSKK